MKKKLPYITSILVFSIFLCFSFFLTNENVSATTFSSSKNQEGSNKTVANLNLYNAKIAKQEENNITITFDISNGEYTQSDIRYSIELIDVGGEHQKKVDKKIYSDSTNISEYQTINKKINYVAPDYLSGNFQIWLIAKNPEGVIMGLIEVGKISLNGSAPYLEIDGGTCYLQVKGEDEKTRYSTMQGVVIKKEETLIANCEIWNHYNKSLTFIPQIKTYKRTLHGDEIKVENNTKKSFSIKSQEKKRFEFVIPKHYTPQAYSSILKPIASEEGVTSNEIELHYVIHGASATIQNINLEKSYYKKDDDVKMTLHYTGSADNFPDSRLKTSEDSKLFVDISIKNSDKEICSEISNDLDSNNTSIIYEFSMIRDCLDPMIKVKIKNENGDTLDEKEYQILSKSDHFQSEKPLKLITYILAVIALIFILFWYKKQNIKTSNY